MKHFICLLTLCLFIDSCMHPRPTPHGHWQGHSGDGVYLELLVDADSVFLYESYRKDFQNYLFPKGRFAYNASADSFLVMHAAKNKPGVIRLPDENNLEIGNGQNNIKFTLISQQVPILDKSVKSLSNHKFRLEMIKREVDYICEKRKISKAEGKMMVEQLTKEENGFYAWLSAR